MMNVIKDFSDVMINLYGHKSENNSEEDLLVYNVNGIIHFCLLSDVN